MADKLITISITGGRLVVSGTDPFEIKPGNTLRFKCAVGEFAVLFDNNRSPYLGKKKAHAAHKGASTPKLTIRHLTAKERTFKLDDRVNGASFKYGVAVMDPGTGNVLTLDPDILIDDQGGGH